MLTVLAVTGLWIGYYSSLENKWSVPINRYPVRCWDCEFVLESHVEKFSTPLDVAGNIRIPDASVDGNRLLVKPIWEMGKPSLVATILSNKWLKLPFVYGLLFKLGFHSSASAELFRRFPTEVFSRTKNPNGGTFSGVMPLQVYIPKVRLTAKRLIGDNPRTANGNLNFGTVVSGIGSMFSLASLKPVRAQQTQRDYESRYFPPWGFAPAALLGLIGIIWGLSHEHSPKRRLAAAALVSGCILWLYGFTGIVAWSVNL